MPEYNIDFLTTARVRIHDPAVYEALYDELVSSEEQDVPTANSFTISTEDLDVFVFQETAKDGGSRSVYLDILREINATVSPKADDVQFYK